MKEDFLHYLWQYKLFSPKLVTNTNEEVIVLKTGTHNKNSGADFLNALLKIDEQKWAGNIEIHLKSSDWYAHHHEIDENYDAVILHVVYENDVDVFMKNNKTLPTVELKNFIDKETLENYYSLFSKQIRWILCENQISEIDNFTMQNWLERLYFERLEEKSILIKELLSQSNNDFEAVLFQLLAKNFGLKLNASAFLNLATSIHFSIIRKERFNEEILSALLFGQAGFLEEELQNEYHLKLKQEYRYLKHKYKIAPIDNKQFQFFRTRPNNFPTIRIAQLVSLYHKHQNLFSELLSITKLEEFYTFFSVGVNEFWKTHYTFDKKSKKSHKKITKSFIDLLLINTIIPLKFVYEQHKGKTKTTTILKLIQQLKPERNSIISKFHDLEITVKNAFESQALLELKNNYCTPKRCLECAIGNDLVRKKSNTNF